MALEKIITHQIDIFRLASSEQDAAVKLLRAMRRDLAATLETHNLTAFSKSRVKALLKQVNEIIANYYSLIHEHADETLAGLVYHVGERTSVILSLPLLSETVLKSIINDSTVMGAPSVDWWMAQAASTAFNYAAQVRQGIAQAETTSQILSRVRPILDVSERNARSLVHTSIQSVMNQTRLAVFDNNTDVLQSVRQLSTLDGHTSDICIAYSNAKWTLPDHKPINGAPAFNGGPPRHFNCRSVLVPVSNQIDIPGQRVSELGLVDRNITFDEFLSKKTTEQQNEMLGVGRAQLWRDGKITLRDLLDQKGRPLTLEQLIKKYA
jgi:hypothetical protein